MVDNIKDLFDKPTHIDRYILHYTGTKRESGKCFDKDWEIIDKSSLSLTALPFHDGDFPEQHDETILNDLNPDDFPELKLDGYLDIIVCWFYEDLSGWTDCGYEYDSATPFEIIEHRVITEPNLLKDLEEFIDYQNEVDNGEYN